MRIDTVKIKLLLGEKGMNQLVHSILCKALSRRRSIWELETKCGIVWPL